MKRECRRSPAAQASLVALLVLICCTLQGDAGAADHIVTAGLTTLPAPAPGAQARQSLEDLLKVKDAEIKAAFRERRYAAAQKALEGLVANPEVMALPRVPQNLFYNLACVQALQGRKAEALAYLRKAVDAGYSDYLSFAEDADFTALRADPEFRSFQLTLRERLGFRPLVYEISAEAQPFPLVFEASDSEGHHRLREEFGLDAVVAGAKDDYERLERLAVWASRQWEHDSSRMASRSDPLTILREARQGGRFICMNYGVVLAGAANAYGIRTRLLNMLPKDVETRSEAHTAVEAWLPQFKKWVLADAQFGLIAERGGEPLNAVELQRAISEESPLTFRGAVEAGRGWKRFIYPNLYFFKVARDQRSFGGRQPSAQLVLVPRGSPLPRVFAGGHPEVFARSTYTANPPAFYAAP